MAAANRFLAETFLPPHNARFVDAPEDARTAFVPWIGGELADILCIQEERTVGNDNTVRYERRVLQIPADRHRHHYVNTILNRFVTDLEKAMESRRTTPRRDPDAGLGRWFRGRR